MQVNTKIQNPTNYFFNQAPKEAEDYSDKINEFTKKLINTNTCVLCKEEFNFTKNIPRILIHCGHTFCTSCLKNFHKNNRVRCPMCLKLVKQIETIDRLPVNHTIFTLMAEEYNKLCQQNGEEQIDAQGALYAQFEASQMNGKKQKKYQDQQQQQQQQPIQYEHQLRLQQQVYIGEDGLPHKMPIRIDEDSGLEWCEYHCDRVKHFLCMSHKETFCRVCIDLFHAKNECSIMDLYEVEDIHAFLDEFYRKNNFYGQTTPIDQELIQALKPNGKNLTHNELIDVLKSVPGIQPNQLEVGGGYQFKQDDHDNDEDDNDDDDDDDDDEEGEFEGDEDDDHEGEDEDEFDFNDPNLEWVNIQDVYKNRLLKKQNQH